MKENKKENKIIYPLHLIMDNKTLENLIVKVGKLEDKMKFLERRYDIMLCVTSAVIIYELVKVIF